MSPSRPTEAAKVLDAELKHLKDKEKIRRMT